MSAQGVVSSVLIGLAGFGTAAAIQQGMAGDVHGAAAYGGASVAALGYSIRLAIGEVADRISPQRGEPQPARRSAPQPTTGG